MEPTVNRRWTQEDIGTLKNLYLEKTRMELAEILGRTEKAVTAKCVELGLNYKGSPRKRLLTREQKLWLKINYPHIGDDICAIKLGCGVRTIYTYAKNLGLRKSAEFIRGRKQFASLVRWRKAR